jgi:putative PIN family toxin of toxin-antitoxin system
MEIISKSHKIILSSYIIEELKKVAAYPRINKLNEVENFLDALPFEYHESNINNNGNIKIRDKNDISILIDAIDTKADILITGDNDFFDHTYDGLEIVKPADFLKRHESF